MRQIDIDFDVHKLIENERKSFDEAPNDALRRLLRLGASKSAAQPIAAAGRAWSGKGVSLPHGTELKMEYRGTEHRAAISDGTWECGGGRHGGPSPAAAAVAVTRDGSKTNLNGWIYWSAKLPGTSSWIPISTMRKG